MNVPRPLFGLLILATVLPIAACDPVEPERLPVGSNVTLYSLARAEYIGEVSGFDFATPRSVLVERPSASNEPTQAFDMVFSELDGEPVWLPAGVFETFRANPGIAVDSSGVTFEELNQAPRDGYVTDAAVPVREGPVYLIRTRPTSGGCSLYGKFEVLEIDADGVVDFRFLRSNLCNDRNLTAADPD